MADIGWGHLEAVQGVGKPYDKRSDFVEVCYTEARSEAFATCTHAVHAMIFTRTADKLWNMYPKNAFVMMTVRFDGTYGFPGGLMDPGENPIMSVNRECEEEIKLDVTKYSFTESDHVVSHHNSSKNLVTHFFAKEVNYDDYCDIERSTLNAKEWGVETYGIVRAPLFVLGDGVRGLPVFLNNKFAGNAQDQLIMTLRKLNIVPADKLDAFLKAAEQYRKDTNHKTT